MILVTVHYSDSNSSEVLTVSFNVNGLTKEQIVKNVQSYEETIPFRRFSAEGETDDELTHEAIEAFDELEIDIE